MSKEFQTLYLCIQLFPLTTPITQVKKSLVKQSFHADWFLKLLWL